jgi:hypothetical protein
MTKLIGSRPMVTAGVILGLALAVAVAARAASQQTKGSAPWSFNATIIEACSCQMFCPCYFSTEPSPSMHAHGDPGGFCRFNMAYKVNKGKSGDVDLAGAKFWIAGDLGDDFGDGQTEWAEVTWDPSVTKEQRDAIAKALLGPVYPWKWNSFTVGKDAPVEWNGGTEKASAKLDGGKGGEIILAHNATAMTTEPTVIKNLKYFAAPRNDGFVLMSSQLEAYRRGDKAFEYKGTNGFMITLDVASTDVK